MKFVIIVAVLALVGFALYQKWRSIPPQTKQMWGALFGMAKTVRQTKKQMREQSGTYSNPFGTHPFERVAQPQNSANARSGSSLIRGCAKCGLHIPANEGVTMNGQFYCCNEHAQ